MALNGYIKLHRKMIEWGWYSDPIVKDVFLHILLTANISDSEYKGYKLKAGQAIIGLNALAKKLGYSTQQVRTALKKLEYTGEICKKSTNKFTVVTVEKWELYQIECSESNKRATNEQQTSNKRATNEQQHLKKKKNTRIQEEKEYNNPPTPQRGVFVPPTIEEVKEFCLDRMNGIDAEEFVDFYQSKGWMVGKNKMKDWRAAVRTWERNKKTSAREKGEKERVRFIDLV